MPAKQRNTHKRLAIKVAAVTLAVAPVLTVATPHAASALKSPKKTCHPANCK
jgi:hypothetical protein